MKKLKLNLDEIMVESFETNCILNEKKGTVIGDMLIKTTNTAPTACETCGESCIYTCQYTCIQVCS